MVFQGLSQTFSERAIIPLASSFSCFINFWQSEEARKQIVLIIDGSASGKAKAFPQPQHRLETQDGSPRRVEGFEATDLWHVSHELGAPVSPGRFNREIGLQKAKAARLGSHFR